MIYIYIYIYGVLSTGWCIIIYNVDHRYKHRNDIVYYHINI